VARSIRFRLTAWYALALTAALVAFSGLIWVSLRQRLIGEMDEELADRAGQFERFVISEASEIPAVPLKDEMSEFCQALPPSSRLELRGSKGFEFHYPVAPVRERAERNFTSTFAAGGETFQLDLASSLTTVDHTLDLLGYLLLGLVPVVVGIACVIGAWLSRRALRPVDEITEAARSISIDNLSLRLPTPQTGDEIQRLTEVWNTMLTRLEDAVRTLSQFAADASHELRTPLSVIRTSAELALRRARDPESYRESLQQIEEEAERMTQLVEDLLFLARHDSQAAEMPREPVDVAAVLSEAAAQLGPAAESRGVRLLKPSAVRPLIVSGNRPALRRLFLVILDNAIKYSRTDSTVRTAISGNAVTIEDNGIGISASDKPHIFKRFYQADTARTDGGFGLGLSLARSIADTHAATIEVESAEGKGTRFQVTFAA
jgi:two-component system heavy metal sensor histidine kinase CusS